jgi:hypothetical protein
MKLPIVKKYVEILRGIQNNMILAPTGNLGIPRDAMPQIDFKYREEFIEFIKANKVKVRNIRVPARSLKMAQGEYNRDKVGTIMDSGNLGGAPIFVSKDGYVIDGNHRLIAHLNLPGASSYIGVTELGLDARSLLTLIRSFPKVRYRNLNNSSS